VEALEHVREYAMQMESPAFIHDEFVKLGPEGFLFHVLGDLGEVFTYPRMVKDVQRSFSLSLDLPFTYEHNHKAFLEEVEPEQNKRAKLPRGLVFNQAILDELAAPHPNPPRELIIREFEAQPFEEPDAGIDEHIEQERDF
jgi:hypothetical protein